MEGLKTHHGLGAFLDETVILLNDNVQIFHAQHFKPPFGSRELQAYIYPLKTGQVGSAFIDYNS